MLPHNIQSSQPEKEEGLLSGWQRSSRGCGWEVWWHR
jgi:hypothetical protein